MLDVSRAGGSTRKDANLKRMAAFRDAGSKGNELFFNDAYGDDQIHLRILGTHPDYMRRGFGSTLTKWGMSMAKDESLVVSLMAGPMGSLLYSHLGFRSLGKVVVQVPEEVEKVYLEPMVFETEKKEKAQLELL
jgi:GNAT superfamily N-acetyltransferase